jgi:hypothetical protein
VSLDDLEAANWRALAAYHEALARPGASPRRCQSALIDRQTSNALAYASAQVSAVLTPVREDPVPLVDRAIDLLAGAMGVREFRAAPKEAPGGESEARCA